MEYIELLPEDEVFPSTHVELCKCAVWFYFYWVLMLRHRLQLPFEAGLVGKCDCRNRNFFSLSDGGVCYGRGIWRL